MPHRATLKEVTSRLIKEAKRADLPGLLAQRGWRLKREGSGYRIPGHGGLCLYQKSDEWLWHHFSAGRGGDAISFLQEWAGMSFREAVEALIGESWPESSSRSSKPKALKPPRAQKPELQGDPEKWREKAKAFVAWAHKKLMAPEGEPMRKWLWERRGLTEETARRFFLGCCPKSLRRDRES